MLDKRSSWQRGIKNSQTNLVPRTGRKKLKLKIGERLNFSRGSENEINLSQNNAKLRIALLMVELHIMKTHVRCV